MFPPNHRGKEPNDQIHRHTIQNHHSHSCAPTTAETHDAIFCIVSHYIVPYKYFVVSPNNALNALCKQYAMIGVVGLYEHSVGNAPASTKNLTSLRGVVVFLVHVYALCM